MLGSMPIELSVRCTSNQSTIRNIPGHVRDVPDVGRTMTVSPAPQAATTRPDDALPVAGLLEVLEALADPVRLEMVRRLDPDGTPAPCAVLYDGVGKSTASHHFKILREAGVIERSVVGGKTHHALRLDAVEERHPGLLRGVLASRD